MDEMYSVYPAWFSKTNSKLVLHRKQTLSTSYTSHNSNHNTSNSCKVLILKKKVPPSLAIVLYLTIEIRILLSRGKLLPSDHEKLQALSSVI